MEIDREEKASDVEGDSIDLISIDDSGYVVLHLLVKGAWADPEKLLHWVRRRLNLYIGFVLSGQMHENPKYRDRKAKFLLHIEFLPPPIAFETFARMKLHLLGRQITFGVTIGQNVKAEVPLPEPASGVEFR